MARWEQDNVDFACNAWAFQWVGHFMRDPKTAREMFGPVGSTLNLQRILTGDIRSGAFVSQQFPEVFMGAGLIVACVLKTLSDRQREVIFRHYVERWWVLKPRNLPSDRTPVYEPFQLYRPVKQAIVAERMGVSAARYYALRDEAKRRIEPHLPEASDSTLNQKLVTRGR